jgi:DHA1 family multidrug resistance protein-like MFS transporter
VCFRTPSRHLTTSSSGPVAAATNAAADDNYSPWADERVRTVCVSTGCLMLGHGVATPILPAFAADLGGAAADVGMAFAAFGAARLLLNLPVGYAVDRVGRKPVLVAGAGLSAIGMLCSGLAVDIPSLICARLVAGAGASCYLGGVQVYLTDIAPPRTQARVLGANHAALLLGVSLGPVLGGCTAELMGLRAPFALIAALNGAAALHAIAVLRETLPSAAAAAPADVAAAHSSAGAGAGLTSSGPPSSTSEPPQPAGPRTATSGSGWAAALRDSRFLGAGVVHAANFALRQGGRNMLLALVAVEQFDYSSGQLGLLFGAMATADLMAVGAASRAADRAHGDARGVVIPGVLGSALACACIGGLASSWTPSGESISAFEQARHPLFLAGVAAWAVATASVGPALPAFAASLAREPAHRGAYVALFRTSGDVGFVLAPLALGYLADYSGAPTAMVALSGVVASATGVFGVLGKPRKLRR